MNKRVLVLTILLALAMLLLAACGATEPADQETDAEPAETAEDTEDTITLIDTMDREVTVQLPIETCYIGFYYENFLSVVGPDAFTKVKATSLYDTEGYFATMTKVFRENVEGFNDMEDVGSTMQDNFDVEKIIEMDLDVLIVGNYQYNGAPEAMEKIEAAGTPVVCINYSKGTEEMQVRSTEILGKLFQVEDRAQEIIDLYREKTHAIVERTSKITDKKTAFDEWLNIISSYREISQSGSPSGYLGLYMQEAGADDIINVFIDQNNDSDNTTMSLEFILDQDPEFYFPIGGERSGNSGDGLLMGYGVTEEEFLASAAGLLSSRPGFANINAVKNNNVYCIEDGILRTMHDYTVVEYMAKSMYPEEFEDIDPEQDFRDFAEKYLPMLPIDDGIFFYHLDLNQYGQ